MKFKDLFEMPTFVNKQHDVSGVKVGIMSVDTLDRDYHLLGSFEQRGSKVVAAMKNDNSSAVIGTHTIRDDGKASIEVMCTLTFHVNADLGELGGKALQVDLVEAPAHAHGAGWGYQLYKMILNAGYTLASDNIQYIGGKELWMKIVRRAAHDSHNVFVLQQGKLLRDKAGQPLAYDGSNIPDDVIWSENKRSEDHYYTLLVARNR